ncbi:hypothetical protein Taro_041418 [Colocasia esculenta]|uniref:Uncharacterized protein n=1 Tax=Colocasia esculenta TaxID=4460 RepID=A0A843WPU2_COLES|nr:hypothetical protein [Colocasia esculenta]
MDWPLQDHGGVMAGLQCPPSSTVPEKSLKQEEGGSGSSTSASEGDHMSKEKMMIMGAGGAPAEHNPNRGGPMSSGLPSWKLYDNPFYIDHHHGGHHRHHPSFATKYPYYNHATRLPISTRKLAASLWDVATLLRHPMDPGSGGSATPDLHLARARIWELKAELDFERRLRKKAEALSRALAREAAEERARREAEERAREGLAVELARAREEAGELRRAVEEERKMMRVAEAMREERVQMKLAEARLLMEEKLLEMRGCSPGAAEAEGSSRAKASPAMGREPCAGSAAEDGGGGGGGATEGEGAGGGSQQRREAENPHIRRGIKGFVEFPKVGRARAGWVAGPREGKGDPGPKLECQMAQLRVLLKHRVPVGMSSSGSVNLVM